MTKENIVGKKYLIIKQSSLGDIIHVMPVLSAIKEENPDNFIGFVVADKFQDVVKNHPLIDKLYIVPRNKFKLSKIKIDVFFEYIKIMLEIFKQKYDIAIDLQGILKSAIMLAASCSKRRVMKETAREYSWIFANELIPINYYRNEDKQALLDHLRTLEYVGIKYKEVKCVLPESTIESKAKVDELLKTIEKNKPIIILSPATTWINKHWNENYWSELLNRLTFANVIFTGTNQDKGLIDRIINGSTNKNVIDISGKTNINQLLEVFRRANLVISPDSGSAHLAWGASKPAVFVICCATPPYIYKPIGEKHKAFPQGEGACVYCFKRDCPKKEDRYICCSQVKPEEVYKEICHTLNID